MSFQQTIEFELSADFNINYTISNLKIKTYDIRTMQRKESNQRPWKEDMHVCITISTCAAITYCMEFYMTKHGHVLQIIFPGFDAC